MFRMYKMIPSQVHGDVQYKQDQTRCVNNKHKDKAVANKQRESSTKTHK